MNLLHKRGLKSVFSRLVSLTQQESSLRRMQFELIFDPSLYLISVEVGYQAEEIVIELRLFANNNMIYNNT